MQHNKPWYKRKAVWSFAFYDWANTIFSYVVLTRYFNDWIIDEKGQADWHIGAMGLLVSLLLIVLLPFLGVLGDQWRRKPILFVATAIAIASTILLSTVQSPLLALFVAGTGIVGFQTALAQYDPLLPAVADEKEQNQVSGLGVAMGYFGVLCAVAILGKIVHAPQQAFLPAGIMFLLGSIPLFIWVKEDRNIKNKQNSIKPKDVVNKASEFSKTAFYQTKDAFGFARKNPFGRLLLARFFYTDAIATVIAFMTVYAKRVGGLDDGQVNLLLASSIVFSIVGAFAAGWGAKKWGPKKVTMWTIALTVFTLIVGALTGSISILFLGPLVGICLGGINTCDRVMALRLAPIEKRGTLFGLHSLVGKLSSGLGPLILWGGTIELCKLLGASSAVGSRFALFVLGIAALIGLLILKPLKIDKNL